VSAVEKYLLINTFKANRQIYVILRQSVPLRTSIRFQMMTTVLSVRLQPIHKNTRIARSCIRHDISRSWHHFIDVR